MPQAETSLPVLLVQAGTHACAIPLAQVMEVLRPLPIEPLRDAPTGVLGLAMIRGAALPVVALATLLDAAAVEPEVTRFVAVRSGPRCLALAVSAVGTLTALSSTRFAELPSLWQGPHSAAITALTARDQTLVYLLATTRLLPADWVPAGAEKGAA